MMTGRVDAVSKERDWLAPRNRGQLFVKDILHRVVEARAAAGARATDGFVDHFTIRSGVALDLNAIVKRHHHHAVIGFELVDEVRRGFLNVFETKLGRAAGVY